ncbi:Alanyl-tRNA editing protein [Candidatus Portiera aleyrodidarum]|uniref:Alanine--tRNA ligase n=1 Tax=Candidatus Portiera aleyrodidarum TV TaxID=1297582 RepID=A0A8D3X7K0_9GAMM|nr:alanine--tRNA ligase-related protein [Candidatus Portiera aleyrodidarum]AGI27178.1 alanyl-tRNA synthetase [Candidatus Portiera aleyrodidarum TV]CEI59158.1 Alanyl-tRNA editing protein [Candidatus Portiera aleyrodidarum]
MIAELRQTLLNKKTYVSSLNIYKYKTKIIQLCNKKGNKIKFIKENVEGIIILKTTSFFFESCGQISDIGYIYNDIGKFKVYHVKKYNNLYLHIGILLKGQLVIDNKVNVYIDKFVRYKLSINHSAIHLLNETLKRVLNINIVKKGCLINEKKITLDFNYYKNISNEQLFIIEHLINNEILKKNIIFIKNLSLQDINLVFETNYIKNKLNVVFIGKEGSYSIEVCNGTHIKNTKNIVNFCIVSEKSVYKGIRRIEALTNKKAIYYILKNNLIVKNISYNIKQNIKNIEHNILNIINKQKIYIDQLKTLQKLNIKNIITKLLHQIFYLYEYKILIKKIKSEYKKDVFLIINKLLKNLLKKSIILLYIIKKHYIYVFIKITKDCFDIINSNVILKKLLKQNQKIIYNKNNDFSYIKTSKQNLKQIKTIIKNILKRG